VKREERERASAQELPRCRRAGFGCPIKTAIAERPNQQYIKRNQWLFGSPTPQIAVEAS